MVTLLATVLLLGTLAARTLHTATMLRQTTVYKHTHTHKTCYLSLLQNFRNDISYKSRQPQTRAAIKRSKHGSGFRVYCKLSSG